MKLSIVTTLFRSVATIDEFYRRVIAAAEHITSDIELVMVNDGSPDHSLDLALDLHRADPRVVVVDLARNFGHHKALMTGLVLTLVTRRGPEAAERFVFGHFRRQHLEKFLPGLAKLGPAGLPHAVACAQYHYLSNLATRPS